MHFDTARLDCVDTQKYAEIFLDVFEFSGFLS